MMKYRIFEVIKPDHLQKTVKDGYSLTTLHRLILEEVSFTSWKFKDTHDSLESANATIEQFCKELKRRQLIALPFWDINYEGEIV